MTEETNGSIPNQDELRSLKTQYNRAKEIIEKANGLLISVDSLQSSINARKEEFEKSSIDAREKLSSIENAKKETIDKAIEAKSNLEKIQSSIASLEEGMRKFENIKGKIEGRESEIDSLMSTADSLKEDIVKSKTSALQRLSEMEALLVQVQDKVSKMQNAYESFLLIQGKIIAPDTGLEAILSKSIDLQKKSSDMFSEINSFREESKKYLEDILENKNSSEKIKEDIVNELKAVKSNSEEVQKITSLITDTGFVNSFRTREKQLFISSIIWLLVLLLSIIGLVVLLVIFFSGIGKIPEFGYIIYRLTLTSPLLILMGFSISQYRHERSLNEKYAFKAAIGTIIRSHSKYLIDVKKEKDLETYAFVKSALEELYVEPYENTYETKMLKMELSLIKDKNNLQNQFTLSDLLQKSAEFKKLFTDDDTFKSVANWLVTLRK